MENKSESRKCFDAGQFAVQGLIEGMEAEPNTQIVNSVKKIAKGANKVENKIYNDDVERIVNESEHREMFQDFYKNNNKRQQKKFAERSIVYSVFAIIFGLLGIYGLMAEVIAYSVLAVCAMYASFNFGRFIENGKCKGWK